MKIASSRHDTEITYVCLVCLEIIQGDMKTFAIKCPSCREYALTPVQNKWKIVKIIKAQKYGQ